MFNPQGRAFRVLLGAQSMVSSMPVDMSLPALPALAAAFSAPTGRVQLTISAYLIGYALGQLFYGPLSDRFGRRPMLLIGLVVYTISGFLCATAPSIEIMIGLRLMQGLGGCVGVVVTRAAVMASMLSRPTNRMPWCVRITTPSKKSRCASASTCATTPSSAPEAETTGVPVARAS